MTSPGVRIEQQHGNHQSHLDASVVSAWLDAHPEYLSDYLRKLQIQRRRSSIMNESVLADLNTISAPSSLLLRSQYSNASSNSTLDETSRLGMLMMNSNNALAASVASSGAYQPLLKFPFLLSSASMPAGTIGGINSAFSEPSILPILNSTGGNLEHSENLPDMSEIIHYRTKFKNLSLYEKMYTLVKILYQSLDLKRTCQEILNTVSLLFDADRCSLFLVTDEDKHRETDLLGGSYSDVANEKCLISVVFDAKSKNKSNTSGSGGKEQITTTTTSNEETLNDEQIRIPYGCGIAGHVAATGQSLNIPDAYADPRFNDTIDKRTGYRTKNVLCLPILDENDECIAVAEAINKLSDGDDATCFTKEDEKIFGKFMPFISIAIRNSNLYTHSRKEAQTNKVLLELATIVFDESSSTVDNLVSRILFNSIFLLECERCQVVLLNTNLIVNNNYTSIISRRSSVNDINKYFDRIYELNYNDLSTKESFSHEILVEPKKANFTSQSPEIKVINQVIQNREIFKIQSNNDISNHLFTDIDINEFPNTKALLCIPVINSSDQVVALIFAYNKLKTATFNFFSKSDINVAQAFALFCGIGIQNIMMYEKVVRAMNMQQVALDVLSYHLSSNQEDVNRLLEQQIPEPQEIGLHSFLFDENTLNDLGTLKACLSMFADLDLIQKFNIPYEILCRFFLTVKKNYRPVAYHNWRHGFNVMASMYQMLTTGNFRSVFNDLEMLSLLIACICHDLDHRGTTNNFQIKIQSPLAKLYSTSTMEHHHFNQCIIILHNNLNNILTNLTPSEHSTAIDLIEKAILATDLALHFKHIDRFLEKTNSPNRSFEAPEDKEILLNILMTACDLSGSAKPWKCHYRLSLLVSSEFFNEGDLEKEKFKQEPIDAMNRNKSDQLPKAQIQFLQSVCVPLYHGLTICNPLLKQLSDTCDENIKEWEKLDKELKLL